MTALLIDNLNYQYSTGKFKLKNVSFTAQNSEITGITGPNGSGKSTLLKIISGIITKYEGTVLLHDNTDIKSLTPVERSRIIGLVPQSFPLLFPVTVIEFILQGRYPHLLSQSFESSKDYDIAEECMELSGVTHLKNRNIQHLSGGEFRLVLLARTLCQKPDILLLDEVTTNLDINFELKVLSLLDRLANEGLCIVLVSHDMRMLSGTASKIMVMKEGRKITMGTSDKVFTSEMFKEVYNLEVKVEKSVQSGKIEVQPL